MADIPLIDLDPYLASVQATLLLLQQLGLIPDLNPLDYIISAFDGKPKLEDTELAALRLQVSPWWPLRALGNNLQIWVRNGVPLSTGIVADRQELSHWIQGTIDSIEPIVFNRFDPYSLDHAIWLSMTSQFGDQAIRQLNDEIANQHAKGPLPAVPPQPGAPPPTPTEVGVHLSRDGDELADYGDTLIFQNSLLYDLLTQIGKELGKTNLAACCKNIVAAIATVDSELTAIADAIGSAGNAGALANAIITVADAIGQYQPLVVKLADCVCALSGNPSIPGVDLTPVVDALRSIAADLARSPGDVAMQLKRLADTSDAADALGLALVQHWATLAPGEPGSTQLLTS